VLDGGAHAGGGAFRAQGQGFASASHERWLQAVQRGARLNHPNLAAAVEIGVQDGWPFVAYELGAAATLADRIGSQGLPGPEVAALALQALQGLAFAHEGGVAHHDVQAWQLLVGDDGALRVAGLGVAFEAPVDGAGTDHVAAPGTLQAQRHAAERDVLALGIVMHHALADRKSVV
jgi:non-specific serine/threonine protein kinase